MYSLKITGSRVYGPIPDLFRPDQYKITYNNELMTIAELAEQTFLIDCMGDISQYDYSRYIIFSQNENSYGIGYDTDQSAPYIGIFDNSRKEDNTILIEIGHNSPDRWFVVYTAYFEDNNGNIVNINKYGDKRPDIIFLIK